MTAVDLTDEGVDRTHPIAAYSGTSERVFGVT